jgi:hypothetical protein
MTTILAPEALSITDYHQAALNENDRWFSKTSLRYFQDMGAPWFKLWLDKQVRPATPKGVEQGLALDALLTEGQASLDAQFVFAPPDLDRRTKAGKEWAEANKGKTILPDDDRLILQDAADAVRRSSAWPSIKKSQSQHTVRRYSDGLRFGLQSRPDWLQQDQEIIWDLKKTRDLSRFGSQAIDLGYHLQGAVARWCLNNTSYRVFLVAVEWERGARCRVYEIPTEALDYAERQMRAAAGEIARRICDDDWIDRQEEAEALEIPGWMMRRMKAEA